MQFLFADRLIQGDFGQIRLFLLDDQHLFLDRVLDDVFDGCNGPRLTETVLKEVLAGPSE